MAGAALGLDLRPALSLEGHRPFERLHGSLHHLPDRLRGAIAEAHLHTTTTT